jgi:hypothetical protein
MGDLEKRRQKSRSAVMMAGMARKLLARARGGATSPAPAVENVTYNEPGNQWYRPVLAGPATFLGHTVGAVPVRRALAVMDQLSSDKYMDFVRNFYRAGLERFGDEWVYADINTVLIGLSRALRVESYLEIGVRRGRSMAMVASQRPQCYMAGFDLWIRGYAGMDNPGADFARSELKRIGYGGELQFFDGDSKNTVPAYFRDHPDRYFDLITVDGDHTVAGARADLCNVVARLKVGGVLVFDDICNQDLPGLKGVWADVVESNPQFASYSFTETGFGIAFAIRKH